MTGLLIFLGAALVASVAAVALSARYRHFDAVASFRGSSVTARTTTLLATPEEVTREKIASSHEYDVDDDLLDPRNAHHARWLEDRAHDDAANEDD